MSFLVSISVPICLVDMLPFVHFQDHESVIKAIYTGSEYLETASGGGEVGVVLESTSFYAEQGGQVL